eukprot:2943689-Pyramimonas_sp.AAC.1
MGPPLRGRRPPPAGDLQERSWGQETDNYAGLPTVAHGILRTTMPFSPLSRACLRICLLSGMPLPGAHRALCM